MKKVMLPFLSDAAGRQGHKGSQPFPRPSSVLVAVGAAVRRVMAPTHTLGPCHKRAHISRERAVTPISGSNLVLMQVSECRAHPHLLPPPRPSSWLRVACGLLDLPLLPPCLCPKRPPRQPILPLRPPLCQPPSSPCSRGWPDLGGHVGPGGLGQAAQPLTAAAPLCKLGMAGAARLGVGAGAWPARPPSLGIAGAVTVTAVLSIVPHWASVSLWDDVCQEPLCAGPSREELSGQMGRGVLSQPALPCHTPVPNSGSEPQPGGWWASPPPLLRPGSLCLPSPQGSWGAGRWLGARAHLSVTLESRCTGATEPLLTSCPQRQGPNPG